MTLLNFRPEKPRPRLRVLLYELKPYVFVLIASFAFVEVPTSDLAQFSGILLLACTAVISYQRLRYRGYLK